VIIVLGIEPFEAALDIPGLPDLYWGKILIYNVLAIMLLEFLILFTR
jgi:hypothetical protein